MVEVGERQGGTPAEWEEEPWEFVLYTYLQLKDNDRRRAFVERLERMEAAELMAIAIHDPRRLADERSRIIAVASSSANDAELRALGRARAAMMDKAMVS